jgi:hypothetical protein
MDGEAGKAPAARLAQPLDALAEPSGLLDRMGKALLNQTRSRLLSAPEERFNIAAASHYVQDEDVLAFDTVNDDIFAAGKAPQTGAEVLVATASQIGVAGEKKKSVRDGINQAIGNFDASAFPGDVIPNIIEFGFDSRGKTMRH